MTTKEPRGESLLAARLAKAYPSLSAYSAASLAEELCRIERAQRRHAERCCSGEDGGYVRHLPTGSATGNGGNITSQWNSYAIVHDPDAERKAGERIERRCVRWLDDLRVASCRPFGGVDYWRSNGELWLDTRHGIGERVRCSIELQHDPRGRVLLLQLPGNAEAVGV